MGNEVALLTLVYQFYNFLVILFFSFFHFEYTSHKIECTLFGPYVDELNAFLASGEVENAVVILQFAKVKLFQGILIIYHYIIWD